MIKPKEYYHELLAGFAASGKNVSKFSKDSGITKHAYYYAKSRLEPLKQKEEKKEMRRKEEKDLMVFLDISGIVIHRPSQLHLGICA